MTGLRFRPASLIGLCLLALAAFLLGPAFRPRPAFASDLLRAIVVSVASGDSLAVADNDRQTHHVRILGIAAPAKGSTMFDASREHLSDLIANSTVNVYYDRIDAKGVTVGKILFGGQDIGLEQLRAGMATMDMAQQQALSPEDRKRYADAQAAATAARTGLWRDQAAPH